MSPQTIDVSGLPEAVVRDLQRLVETIRTAAVAPPRAETPEEWVARLVAWAERHPRREIVIDDSRESIYEGRGE